MGKLVLILLLALPFSACVQELDNKPDYINLKMKSETALTFCKSNEMNIDFCILIDLSRHSGLDRFFIWDFTKDTITHSFPVSHGCCDNPWSGDYSKEKAKTSNVSGSHCSAEGKYKIGKRGYSNWGININYLLHGLEAGNKNALERQIVLHSWEKITDNEIYPVGTAEGWGCPAISNNNMKIVDEKLKATKRSVLLWIFL